jgi:hypothetical protein
VLEQFPQDAVQAQEVASWPELLELLAPWDVLAS